MALTQIAEDVYGKNSKIYELSSESFDEFYNENQINFSTLFKNNYLKELAIPENYFNKQNEKLQRAMIVNAKANFIGKNKKMLLLERKNHGFVFSKVTDADYNFVDNLQKTNINEFHFIREDLHKGYQQFFYSENLANAEDFEPGMFIHIPFFNYGKMDIHLGSIRLKCLNGAFDSNHIAPLKFQANDKFLADNLPYIITGLLSSVKDMIDDNKKMFELFKTKALSLSLTKQILKEHKERINCNHVVNNSLKHIEFIEKNVEIPDESPIDIKTYFDYFSCLSFYAKYNVQSLNTIAKNSAKVTTYAKTLYNDITGKSIMRRGNLDTYYKQLVTVNNN